MKNIVVLYHEDCLDGFGAAWAAWKKFGNKAEYIALNYGKEPVIAKNKEIYFVDFCYPKEVMAKFLKNNKKVVVIDHHISRKEDAKMSSEYVFNLDNSGSVLAWKYFHANKAIPKLLLCIQDIDLWRFNLPFTKELVYGIESYDKNFTLWNKLAADFEKSAARGKYIQEGKAIEKSNNKTMEIIMEGAEEVVFEGKKALAVNSSVLGSELGNFMARKMKYPVGIIWQYKNNRIFIQLRSWNKVDVSKIAKKYGGGGHKNASGFNMPANFKFPWKKTGLKPKIRK